MKKTDKVLPFKRIYFTNRDAAFIENAVINGKTLAEIAEYFDVAEATLQKNLSLTANKDLKERYRVAKAKLISDTTQSAKRIAEGYTYTEKEYKSALKPMSEDYFNANLDKFKQILENKDFNEFVKVILDGMIDSEASDVKIMEKYAKPDLGAVRDILRAHNSEVWDLDAKHKAIPTTKIVVKVENEPQRKREVKPDYVVEA